MAWKDIDADLSMTSDGDIEIIEGEEAVSQGLLNCCLIKEGENLRDINFGNSAHFYLDDFASEPTRNTVADIVSNTIKNYEPRANIKNIETSVENNRMKVLVYYKINNTEEYITTFYVERLK